ncbi:MAG: UvrB/UvrC motif-containing protein [Gemmatimonadetes bacterium]|nr:UvrB/UvrC motif-containing protein [Gemmatimonadota bacterium]
MQCEECKKNKAVIHFTQIVNDETETKHLCQKCAAKKGLQATPPATMPLADFLSGIGGQIFAASPESGGGACPDCGSTFADFRRTGKLGCARCYVAFEREMRLLLRKIHGSHHHVGISGDPKSLASTAASPQARLRELRGRLKDAVSREAYELAAKFRDQIVTLESELGDESADRETSAPAAE